MSSTTTDQVTIDVENGTVNVIEPNDSMQMDLIAVDGRRRHNRHGSDGSHHHSHHSGESDADDRHGPPSQRRNRRRSRSRSRSPSLRSKRVTDTAVSSFRTQTHKRTNHKYRRIHKMCFITNQHKPNYY